MNLQLEPYLQQVERWPAEGRHILAQFDDDSIVVYQAYRRQIGHFAAKHGYFGGDFKLSRMSWIKPNFLWMMYRSGWGKKEGQEVVLAVRIKRAAFDLILSQAVHSTYVREVYSDQQAWKRALANSDIRLQFDPDHDPFGKPLERRAIQLGLRGEVLAKYAREWIVEIEDVSDFVQQQHQHVERRELSGLQTPREEAYPVADADVRLRLGLA